MKNMTLLTIVSILLIGTSSYAIETKEEPVPTGRLFGIIMDASALTPVEGATVKISPGNLELQTDVSGLFLFQQIAYGEYAIQVKAVGYRDTTQTVEVDGSIWSTTTIWIIPTEAEITSTIAGAVVDATNLAPIAGAQITLTPGDIVVQSSSEGAFVFENLAFATYTIEVTADGYQSLTQSVTLDNPIVAAVDIQLIPVGSQDKGTIAGIVSDEVSGLPIQGAQVTAMPGGFQVETTIAGSFTIENVNYGEYVIEASANGYIAGSASITVDAPLPTPMTVTLRPLNVPDEGEGEVEGEDENEGEDESEDEGEGEDEDEDEVEGEVEGEGEDESTNPLLGCFGCQNNKNAVDWLFILKEYLLISAAMITVCAFSKRA